MDKRNLSSWRVPDIGLVSEGAVRKSVLDSGGPLASTYPVGSLLPSSYFASKTIKDGGVKWMRLLPRNKDENLKGCVASLDSATLRNMYEEAVNEADTCPVVDERMALSDAGIGIRGPLFHVGSSDWLMPLVDRIKRFSSLQVQLFGSTGSGKTHISVLLCCLASLHQNRPVLYLNCKKLQKSSAKMAGILGELDAVFRQAQEMGSCIILLDDLDALSPNLLGSGENNSSAKMHSANPTAVDQSKLIADRISHLFEATASRSKTTLISTCASDDSVNLLLSKVGQVPFVKSKIQALSEQEQSDLLRCMIQHSGMSSGIGCSEFAASSKTSGLLPRDLEKLSFRMTRHWQSNPAKKTIDDVLVAALADFTPLSQMQASSSNKGGAMMMWNDIGGIFDVKEKLESVVRHPMLYRRIYDKSQIRLPRGVLLYGPPGCGKSILIPALAQECNYPIVMVRGPEIFDKYIGASEAKIRNMFERATQMAPSILFLDELEALAPRRGSDSTGVTDRVVNQLLTFLDGVEDASSGTVYIVGATSRPDKVVSTSPFFLRILCSLLPVVSLMSPYDYILLMFQDPAVIRPGRLERHLFVGPPNSDEEWSDLLVRTSKHWSLTTECVAELSNPGFLKSVKDIPRLSPADARAAFDTAHLNAVHRTLAKTPASEIRSIEIDVKDLRAGFQETRPSLNEAEAHTLDTLYRPYQGRKNSSGADKVSELKTTLR
ncbi:MAG: hypothetical protein SGILL_004584 [Bacillariaceae sp.]